MPEQSIFQLIESEINTFQKKGTETHPGVYFNQYNHLKILLSFDRMIYETGKRTSQGDYKYWFDIIGPRIEDEVKAIDINTSNFLLWSPAGADSVPIFYLQNGLRNHLRDTDDGVEVNEAQEEYSGFGNVLFKECEHGYERVDMKNCYLSNSAAKSVSGKCPDSAVIERHEMSCSQLTGMKGIWHDAAIKNIIKNYKEYSTKTTSDGNPQSTETPVYEIYERNGEINLKQLKEIRQSMGKRETVKDGDEDIYVLAKVIVVGLKMGSTNDDGKNVLKAKQIDTMPYIEAHRGRYKGTWWRDGLIGILLDLQVRANEIGFQIAKGLEWAAKVIFYSPDTINLPQNIMDDLQNGDVVKAKDLKQVDVRLHNLDQLIAEWNRIILEADRISKSTEISRGEAQPAGTPAKLGKLLDTRSSEFHSYIRQKFCLAYREVIREWMLPKIIEKMKGEEIIRITGDSGFMEQYRKMAVNSWFNKNIETFGRLPKMHQDLIKSEKMAEMKTKPQMLAKMEEGLFTGVMQRLQVIITGENVDLVKELQNNYALIQLEVDPIRRSALIENVYTLLGKNISSLPKSEPEQMATISAPQNQKMIAAPGEMK